MSTNKGLNFVKFAKYAEPIPIPRKANISPPLQQNAAANAGIIDRILSTLSFISLTTFKLFLSLVINLLYPYIVSS